MASALRPSTEGGPTELLAPDAAAGAFAARVAAALFAVGGLISFAVVLLPHPEEFFEAGFWAIGAMALGTAGLMHWHAERFPSRLLPLLIAGGTCLISLDIYFSGESIGSPSVDNEMLYLWVALYSAYFFSRRQVLLQIGWIAVGYLAVLVASAPPSVIATRWSETVGTLAVSALLVQVLRDRVSELVGRLADAARTDSLTGLRNRRALEELVEVEIERARRTSRPLTVVVGDVDHFKRVNDRLGHPAGDAALVLIGELLTLGKRQIDMVARSGGEEFTLVLPDTPEHDAYLIAERLRTLVGRKFAGEVVPLTFSFGVATFPAHGASSAALQTSADQALYAAKQLGRNRTVIYSDEIANFDGGGKSTELHLATLLSLAEALDLRDTGTADHSETVGRYCALIAEELGLPASRVERVRIAGILHDIGKIGLPDAILQKPSPLTDEEWAEMMRHPEIAAGILGNRNFDDVRAWVLTHHERPDGHGYPRGLTGEAIPLEARILAVADAYAAMTANRIYRAAIGPKAAQSELRRGSGSQFDPRVVSAFLAVLEREARVGAPMGALRPTER
jgi:diguanylate cyclase (GGDEF)-like protein